MDTFRATSDTIACTLTPDDLKETQAAWDKLLRVSLVSREEVPGGLRLIVHPGSADALRRLIDVERDCCRWLCCWWTQATARSVSFARRT